jgi:hypothetical protein
MYLAPNIPRERVYDDNANRFKKVPYFYLQSWKKFEETLNQFSKDRFLNLKQSITFDSPVWLFRIIHKKMFSNPKKINC